MRARLPVARHRDLQGAEVALQALSAFAVAAVAAVVPFDGMLLVAQMRGQLGLQRPLHQRLGQLLQQPVLA